MAGKRKDEEAVPGGPDAPAMEEPDERKQQPVELDTSTPSGAALASVGAPPDDASDEELNEHAARYQDAKRKARWG